MIIRKVSLRGRTEAAGLKTETITATTARAAGFTKERRRLVRGIQKPARAAFIIRMIIARAATLKNISRKTASPVYPAAKIRQNMKMVVRHVRWGIDLPVMVAAVHVINVLSGLKKPAGQPAAILKEKRAFFVASGLWSTTSAAAEQNRPSAAMSGSVILVGIRQLTCAENIMIT